MRCRGRPPMTHPLSRKIREPGFWFRNADEVGFPLETADPVRIGVLGGGSDLQTVHVCREHSPQHFRATIAQRVGLGVDSFRVAAPMSPIHDLFSRGVPVRDVIGIVPEALQACVAVFLDARDLACPVQLLLLPPFRTTLRRILHLIGATTPHHRRLQVRGSSNFCSYTESLLPEPNSVLCFSVAPTQRDSVPNHRAALPTSSDHPPHSALPRPSGEHHSAVPSVPVLLPEPGPRVSTVRFSGLPVPSQWFWTLHRPHLLYHQWSCRLPMLVAGLVLSPTRFHQALMSFPKPNNACSLLSPPT